MALIARNRAERAFNRLHDRFDREAGTLALRISTGKITSRQFQRQFIKLYKSTVLQAAMLGKGTFLDANDIRRVNEKIVNEIGNYFYKYAHEISVKRMGRRPIKAEGVQFRLKLYMGNIRSDFYRSLGERTGEGGVGIVERYVALDDSGTCTPCHEAATALPNKGLYLPGQGPMPGSVCLGRGRCRCWREIVKDMAAYKRLTQK